MFCSNHALAFLVYILPLCKFVFSTPVAQLLLARACTLLFFQPRHRCLMTVVSARRGLAACRLPVAERHLQCGRAARHQQRGLAARHQQRLRCGTPATLCYTPVCQRCTPLPPIFSACLFVVCSFMYRCTLVRVVMLFFQFHVRIIDLLF